MHPSPSRVPLLAALRVPGRSRLARRRLSRSDRARGAAFMLLSALGFSVMSLCVKLASASLPTMEIVFARSVLMGVTVWALARRLGLPTWGVDRRTLLWRGTTGATALSLLYFGLGRLPLGDAVTIHYTAPVWTALSAAVLLGERLRPAVLASAAVSLGGVALVARPSFLFGGDARLDAVGVAAVTVGAVLSGLAYTFVRRLRATDHAYTIIFYLSAVGAAIALPFAPGWVWPTASGWGLLAGIGASTLLAQIFLTRGLHLLEAGTATAIGYVQIVFAFGWGVAVFGEAPTPAALAGAAVIVLATLALARSRAA